MVEVQNWADRRFDDEYPAALGKLIANISTLELSLRIVLYLSEVPVERRLPVSSQLATLSRGDELEESRLTSWEGLGELIAEYSAKFPTNSLPKDIVDVRNAFAHGRILSSAESSELRLIKFNRPRGGRVSVEFSQTLSLRWINEQIHRVYEAASSVGRHLRSLQGESERG